MQLSARAPAVLFRGEDQQVFAGRKADGGEAPLVEVVGVVCQEVPLELIGFGS